MEAFEDIYNKSKNKANPRKMNEEIVRLFDGADQRSFEDVYGKDSSLFENVDDVIDSRKRKLFEEVYRNNNQIRIKEDNEEKQHLEENKDETFENKYELSEDRKADLKLKDDTFQEIYQTEKEQLKEYETYNDLYGEQLNENSEDDWGGIIDTKLEESEEMEDVLYKNNLKEDSPPGGYNFTGDEPGPSGDGVPAAHNKPGIGGSDPAVVQSGQDYSRNSKFFESIYEKTHEKVLDKLDERLEEEE